MSLIAFHGKQEVKDKYLSRVRNHRELDEIVKGKYWDGKGCAVGCTVHSSDHKSFEIELGIPEWLARVEDTLFEGMPNEDAKLWPERLLSAIKPGVDLEMVKSPFLIFVLESALEKFDHEKFPDCKAAIVKVIDLYRTGEIANKAAAAAAAYVAAAAAAYAADAAARAAAYVADAAAYAAAARAAAAAAYAARAAARAAAAAYAAAYVAAAYAADAAAYAAARDEYKKFADKLIELIEGLE